MSEKDNFQFAAFSLIFNFAKLNKTMKRKKNQRSPSSCSKIISNVIIMNVMCNKIHGLIKLKFMKCNSLATLTQLPHTFRCTSKTIIATQ